MKVILINRSHGGTRSFKIGAWSSAFLCVCMACFIGVPAAVYFKYAEFGKSERGGMPDSDVRNEWARQIGEQKKDVERTRELAEQKLSAITLRIAELQARLVRLDALGERLTSMAKLDNGEFDFSRPPALGGPESELSGNSFTPPEFVDVISELANQIENRQHQLETLEALLENRKLKKELFIAGRPIKKGWMSSRYGRRADPFSGKIAWHAGVDFAGKEDADIVAVASGVVTISGSKHGYGALVEINHGNGFKTRYAHNKSNLVKVGDVVKKGQVVALMGSTGRSTGPHVHFEVFKNGRTVDPAAYIHRTSR